MRAPPAPRRPENAVDPVDAGHYYGILESRFGIPRSTFDPYLCFRANSQALWILGRDLELPERPDPYAMGMPFFYVRMRWPRPTTHAACRFGHLATRNTVDLDPGDLGLLLAGTEFAVAPDVAAGVDGNGYVFVRCYGRVMGSGYFRPEGSAGWLKGLCPKRWAVRLGVDVPKDEPADDGSV